MNTDTTYTDMTDDEFEEYVNSSESAPEPTNEHEDAPDTEIEETEPASIEVDSAPETEEEDVESYENHEQEETDFEENDVDSQEEGTPTEDNSKDDKGEESPEESAETSTESDTTDYEAYYTEATKPLKVSGKEIEVRNLTDLRNFAQMGIDYSSKMRDIKPLRAVKTTLSEVGIISEDGVVDTDKLSFLADVAKGNKNAILKLVTDNKIDLLDEDTDSSEEYIPETVVPTEAQLDLQEVEATLRSNDTLDSVVSEVSQMDVKSKEFFTENPQNLLHLSQDIEKGVFSKVMGIVMYEKSLGRLQGMSDMEAYMEIVNHTKAPATPVTENVQTTAQSKPKRSTKGTNVPKSRTNKTAVKPKKYDYINMSDEEFEAQVEKDLKI